MNEYVMRLALCEQDIVVFKPNQLYLFHVDENCEKCRQIHKLYLEG